MIVTIANQKGGVCKTSTAVSLASELKRRGFSVLLVDTDPQGNLSFAAHAGKGSAISDFISGKLSAAEAIQRTPEGLHIITSDPSISRFQQADPDLLKKALGPIQKAYDVVIIDTPPTLSGITINAIRAADLIIIPATPSILSLQGIQQLYDVIRHVNQSVRIAGVLLTKYTDRSIINRQLRETAEALAAKIGTKVYKTHIRQTIAMEEAFAMQTPIRDYAPRSTAAEDYASFAEEFIKEELPWPEKTSAIH